MDLGGNAYGKNLRQALKEKLIGMQDIDRAVANILRLKFRMGLFENPYVSPEKAGRIMALAYINWHGSTQRSGITEK